MNNEKELTALAIRVKFLRNELNLSQEILADKCGFDRTYISLIERKKRNPSFLNLRKLCQGLEVSLSEFTEGL